MEQVTSISREEAASLLDRDPLRHFTMSILLKDALNPTCFRTDDRLFVRSSSDDGAFAFFAAGTSGSLESFFTCIAGSDSLFYLQGDLAAEQLRSRIPLGRCSDCIQFHLPDEVQTGETDEGIIDLLPEHADYIHSHYTYKDVTTAEYLRERIETAPAVGVMVNGVLAGFVMTHEEMTMGVMHVLPEYRRLGLASRLNAAMVRRMRALGYPCLIEIVKDNTASLALAKAAGYQPVQKVHWMHRASRSESVSRCPTRSLPPCW